MNTPKSPCDEEKTPVNEVEFFECAPAQMALTQLDENKTPSLFTATESARESSRQFFRGTQVAAEVEEALVRLKAATLLEDLYEARDRLLVAQKNFLQESAQAHRNLEKRSMIFMKSVESAQSLASKAAIHATEDSSERHSSSPSSEKLVSDRSAYAQFLQSAQASLRSTEDELERRDRSVQSFFEIHLREADNRIQAHVQALLESHRPKVTLSVQSVGAENAVVWLEKPTGDDGVLLFWLLNHHLPTHYAALFDDDVDDATLESPTFYEEDGFAMRPNTLEEADDLVREGSLSASKSPFIPYKAHLPFRLEGTDFPRFRLVNQGPVLQLLARGKNTPYEALMSLTWAEMASGLFIQLQVTGAIELTFHA